ncbi:MAG: hypothetical protein LC795_22615 [Acidobacteria bacterium]|nr:hypothetical protein [Acidobacteriota bacterium]
MLRNSRQNFRPKLKALAALLLLAGAAATSSAQSGEVSYPTPVFSGEVGGRIAPRDVGDSRRTRHFYTFRGTEGDLVVSLETSQLIGDVDVYTATTLRPLIKFTLFGDPARLSKSFYLRKDETLVLRVEARAVGDAEGTYTIRFGGSFSPAPAELASAPERPAPTLSPADPRRAGTRRVTATGARIDEPKPEPTPVEEAREEARPSATPTPESSAGRRGATANRRGRGTRNPPARARAGTTTPRPDEARPETAGARPAEESSAGTPSRTEATPAPTPPRRRAGRAPRRAPSREGTEARSPESAARPTEGGATEPAAPPAPVVTAQRLVIVLKDGETLERDMSGVRRVTVENNQVVIVGRDGKVTRRPLASVVRMSIEP